MEAQVDMSINILKCDALGIQSMPVDATATRPRIPVSSIDLGDGP